MRTTGSTNELVPTIINSPSLIRALIEYIDSKDGGLAMRSADTLQKVFAKRPDLLEPYKQQIFNTLLTSNQKEVKWHISQILPSFELNKDETEQAVQIWKNDFNNSKSSIVRVAALQAIFEISKKDNSYTKLYLKTLQSALEQGTPAMKARARILASSSDN